MFFFGRKPKSYLGVDIGASAVKLVELEKEQGRHKLKNYGLFPLAEYFKQESHQTYLEPLKIPSQEMAEIVKRVIKEAKISARDAYLSIPVYSSFSTLIEFPPMSEKEIVAAIPYEARKYVPVPISEVLLDWSVVSPAKQGGNIQILLIAVLKEIINNCTQIIKLSNLNLKAIEAETFSLSRALVGNDKSAIILIDVGARSVSISIVDNGYIRLTHNLEMGGIKMTKTIAQQTSLTLEEAEKIKKSLSAGESIDKNTVQIKGIISSVAGAVIIEIRKIIELYQNKYNRKIEKGILVGGVSQTFGFADYFINKLGIEVSVGNPFARVAYPPILEPVIKEIGPCLAVAVGLAMRE